MSGLKLTIRQGQLCWGKQLQQADEKKYVSGSFAITGLSIERTVLVLHYCTTLLNTALSLKMNLLLSARSVRTGLI